MTLATALHCRYRQSFFKRTGVVTKRGPRQEISGLWRFEPTSWLVELAARISPLSTSHKDTMHRIGRQNCTTSGRGCDIIIATSAEFSSNATYLLPKLTIKSPTLTPPRSPDRGSPGKIEDRLRWYCKQCGLRRIALCQRYPRGTIGKVYRYGTNAVEHRISSCEQRINRKQTKKIPKNVVMC